MADTTTQYERLGGSGYRRGLARLVVATRSTLWLGQDHLLVVDSQFITEEYKRFDYRDIECIVSRTTNGSNLRLAIQGGATVLMLALAFGTGDIGAIVFGIFAAVFGVFLLWESILRLTRGATCRTYLRTFVVTEELPALNRVRLADRAIERLRERIERAQPAA
jgi:hypothetical protein